MGSGVLPSPYNYHSFWMVNRIGRYNVIFSPILEGMAPISIFGGRSATSTSRVKAELCTPTPAYAYPIPRISKFPRTSAGVYYYNQSQALEIVPWGTEYKVYAFNEETTEISSWTFPPPASITLHATCWLS